uniref:NFATC2-interacting protein n=1 Tax=Sinocyclocheilus rhinocerous TaxID=307959 RepID=A0A673GWE2_9TELE
MRFHFFLSLWSVTSSWCIKKICKFAKAKYSTVIVHFFLKNAPLGSILSQYVSGLSASARWKAKFIFDGSRVSYNQTPADLDMEDGDVIEVWA